MIGAVVSRPGYVLLDHVVFLLMVIDGASTETKLACIITTTHVFIAVCTWTRVLTSYSVHFARAQCTLEGISGATFSPVSGRVCFVNRIVLTERGHDFVVTRTRRVASAADKTITYAEACGAMP